MNENKRLIYADDLLNEMEAGCIPIREKGISGVLGDESCIKDYIDNAPIVEVGTLKHGEWIPDNYEYNHCSECGYEHDSSEYVTPYCPNCGAKMDLEE